jgi:hypothetical protein
MYKLFNETNLAVTESELMIPEKNAPVCLYFNILTNYSGK